LRRSKAVATGVHAMLLVDQAGWHKSTRLVAPPNITIVALPPKSPNSTGRKRLAVHARQLTLRVCKFLQHLVDHCCEASNKLVDQPWRIMSTGRIGSNQWDITARPSCSRLVSKSSKRTRVERALVSHRLPGPWPQAAPLTRPTQRKPLSLIARERDPGVQDNEAPCLRWIGRMM
jgi:hypothetical protein